MYTNLEDAVKQDAGASLRENIWTLLSLLFLYKYHSMAMCMWVYDCKIFITVYIELVINVIDNYVLKHNQMGCVFYHGNPDTLVTAIYQCAGCNSK